MKLGFALVLLCLVQSTLYAADPSVELWTYDGRFHQDITDADRIVVRETFDDQRVLFEVTNARKIKEVYEHLKFQSPQTIESCMCSGYPVIDWYNGDQRLALTSVKHGVDLRWKGFPGDVRFTAESADWVVAWLETHGVSGLKEQVKVIREAEIAERNARPILNRYVPAAFLDALERAKVDALKRADAEAATKRFDPFDYLKAEEELFDKYLRAAFPSPATMYTTLFRIVGCLPVRWNIRYTPEQSEAYDCLIRAPREELDRAIRSAARSKDTAERRGAAQLVFSQHYMTIHDKSEEDIAEWMILLATAAYADPIPENRRLVLDRLSESPDARVFGVFEAAVSDPDQTVRHKAVDAIASLGGPQAVQILRAVANGEIQPRVADALPTDFSAGGVAFNTSGMDAIECPETDQVVAQATLDAMASPNLTERLRANSRQPQGPPSADHFR